MKKIGMFVLAALIVTGAYSAPAKASDECVNHVLQTLETKGIKEVVKSTESVPVYNSEQNQVIGYTVWIRLERCPKGFVVANTTDSCFIQNIYSRGGCRVDGLSYWPF